MKVKFVKQIKKVRFYELDEPITIGINRLTGRSVDIVKEFNNDLQTFIKAEYRDLIKPLTDGLRLIAISDASTHTERLVFPAFTYIKNGELIYDFMKFNIEGYHTMSIYEGDSLSIKKPYVYIKSLAMKNKKTFTFNDFTCNLCKEEDCEAVCPNYNINL